MSAPKHTPGPWTPHVAYDDLAAPAFYVDDGKEATREDMRLIAAAPALADALGELLWYVDKLESIFYHKDDKGPPAIVIKARAAIALIDGEPK